jgi:hypothetical protein
VRNLEKKALPSIKRKTKKGCKSERVVRFHEDLEEEGGECESEL